MSDRRSEIIENMKAQNAKLAGALEYAESKLRHHHSTRGGILVIADAIKQALAEYRSGQ